MFLFCGTSTPALEPAQVPICWVPAALFLRLKQPGHEADNSLPSNHEVKNV